jgi:heme iron utilization protein
LLGGFHDFKLYHFAVSRAQVVAGFGRAGRVTLEVYQDSKPDLLALSLPGIVSHMNQDHAQNLLDYAHALLEKPWATQATLIGIDRYGMDLHLGNTDKTEVVRYMFETPLENAAASRSMLVKLSQISREKLGKSA